MGFKEDVDVVKHEMGMLEAMRTRLHHPDFLLQAGDYQTAVVENLCMHARSICDIFMSKGGSPDRDDITLNSLGCSSALVPYLETAYGIRSDPESVCWQFNKRLIHASDIRSDSHNYAAALTKIFPFIQKIWDEVRPQLEARLPGKPKLDPDQIGNFRANMQAVTCSVQTMRPELFEN